jgi:hypothetical protein
MTDEQREAIIQRALDLLAEHFEVCQLFVQVHHGGDHTQGWEAGFGNMFARELHVHRWSEEVYHEPATESDDEEED